MDGMLAMRKWEQDPFLFLSSGGEASMDDEFMVVPIVAKNALQTPPIVDDELEGKFADVTSDTLSPPSVDYEHEFCSINGGGRQQSDSFIFGHGFLFEHQHETFLQQHQLFDDTNSNFSATADSGPVQVGDGQDFDEKFDYNIGQDGLDPVQVHEFAQQIVVEDAVALPAEEEVTTAPVQFSELEDPDAIWLTEPANLAFIDAMNSQNEQHCQFLDELLRDDDMFQDVEPSSIDDEDTTGSEYTEASDILNEIYREAQQLDFASSSTAYVPRSMSTRIKQPVATVVSKPSAQYHLADHDFGAARRGRPPGPSRKRGVLKRDLKNKKQSQNREAALRYRLKKKAEKLEKDSELEQLQRRNQFLKNEKYSLAAEVRSLKELLLAVRKLKGCQ